MEFTIKLDKEEVVKYAKFLGYDQKEIEDGLDRNESFINTLEHDISSVIDYAISN